MPHRTHSLDPPLDCDVLDSLYISDEERAPQLAVLVTELERHVDVQAVVDENDLRMLRTLRMGSTQNVARMGVRLYLEKGTCERPVTREKKTRDGPIPT